ncbi:HAD family phosphatase [Brevibacterium pityocampae]
MDTFAAVLWDMDGTLVDTEPYWMRAETDLMHAHGLNWDEEKGLLMVGNDLLTSARILVDHGLPLPPEEIVEILLDAVIEQVAEHVPFRPGARELLDALHAADIPCALVTMSYRRLAEAVVAACPPGSFRALVTGDEVPAGKPDPAPYVLGAEALGLAPEDCVALEDSIPGLTSAEAAGTLALGVPHLVPIPEAPGRVLLPGLSGISPVELREIAGRMRSGRI